MALVVTHLPTQETWVQSLDGGALDEEMATHSGILAWKSPWPEKPGRLQSIGSQRDVTKITSMCTRTHRDTFSKLLANNKI